MSQCGGCANARQRCGGGTEKLYPTTAVRYGRTGLIGEFVHDADLAFTCGGKVVIQTDRGIEIGQQVSLTCFGCEQSITRDKMRAYAKESGGDAYRLNNGRILREATPADVQENKHLQDEIFQKIEKCRVAAEQLGLPMKIVDAEHIFGGERIIFYFMAEDRIDFRELVRQLAREFQTRIEMRQVGARDEARLLADYETCGRECCCKNFLKTLKPVGMQMAKLQKATLDPSKVSGRCGRLKCCLRYEHDSYAELNKKLPRLGRRVRTETEVGVIIDRQIITQLLRIRKDDGTVVTIRDEDIVERDLPAPPPPPTVEQENGDRGNGRGARRRPETGAGQGQGRPGRGGPAEAGNRRPKREGTEPQRPQQQKTQPPKPLENAVPADESAFSPVDEPLEETLAQTDADLIEESEETVASDEQPQAEGASPSQPERGQSSGPAQGEAGQGRRRNRNRRRRRRNGGNRPASPGSPPPGPA